MNKFMDKLPKITLYALLVLSVIFTVMFWVGGGSDVVINGETWNEPANTGLYLNWAYILCGVALVLVVVIALVRFGMSFVESPKKAFVSLLVLATFVALFVISWSLGSDAKMDIIGYEGTDNVGVMAQYSDMCLYVAYVLMASVIVTLFGTSIYSKFK